MSQRLLDEAKRYGARCPIATFAEVQRSHRALVAPHEQTMVSGMLRGRPYTSDDPQWMESARIVHGGRAIFDHLLSEIELPDGVTARDVMNRLKARSTAILALAREDDIAELVRCEFVIQMSVIIASAVILNIIFSRA